MIEHSKAALITGASGGIGREVAMGLAADGDMLSLTARSKSRLEALVDEIRRAREESIFLITAADVTVLEYAETRVMQVLCNNTCLTIINRR